MYIYMHIIYAHYICIYTYFFVYNILICIYIYPFDTVHVIQTYFSWSMVTLGGFCWEPRSTNIVYIEQSYWGSGSFGGERWAVQHSFSGNLRVSLNKALFPGGGGIGEVLLDSQKIVPLAIWIRND